MTEKRSYPRLDTTVKVKDFTTFKTRWTKNLSLGGCLIERCDELDSLSMVSQIVFKFEIPGVNEAVLASGIVKHTGKNREGFILFKRRKRKLRKMQYLKC